MAKSSSNGSSNDSRFAAPQMVEIRESPNRGLGVFAVTDIEAGATIERAPVLEFPTNDLYSPAGTALIASYVFARSADTVGLTLGFGSLYNHSWSPNANYEDLPGNVKHFYAVEAIKAGEEVTINYNGAVDDDSPVGFDVT